MPPPFCAAPFPLINKEQSLKLINAIIMKLPLYSNEWRQLRCVHVLLQLEGRARCVFRGIIQWTSFITTVIFSFTPVADISVTAVTVSILLYRYAIWRSRAAVNKISERREEREELHRDFIAVFLQGGKQQHQYLPTTVTTADTTAIQRAWLCDSGWPMCWCVGFAFGKHV